MLDKHLINSINTEIPELNRVRLCLGGKEILLTPIDLINTFILYKNFLDDHSDDILIVRPNDNIADIILLILSALFIYKRSIKEYSSLTYNEFVEGEIVRFEEKVVLLKEFIKNPETGVITHFKVQYGDKHNFFPTSTTRLISEFHYVSKYSGHQENLDTTRGVTRVDEIQYVLGELIGVPANSVKVAGYPGILVITGGSNITDLLYDVTINGIPFYKLFPSEKRTANEKSSFRDSMQRQSVFFFTSNMSNAIDILAEENSIKTVFSLAGNLVKYSALLRSIRNDYAIEDIFMLQDYSHLDQLREFKSLYDFDLWYWQKADFVDMAKLLSEQEDNKNTLDIVQVRNDFGTILHLLGRHNNLTDKLAKYTNEIVDIAYPEGITFDDHSDLLYKLAKIRKANRFHQNNEINIFLRLSYSFLNRMLQSPLSLAEQSHLKNIDYSKFVDLIESKSVIVQNSLPPELKMLPEDIISTLKKFQVAFNDYHGKFNQLLETIKALTNEGKIGVVVKKPELIPTLTKKLSSNLNNYQNNRSLYKVVSAAEAQQENFNTLIWLFNPNIYDELTIEYISKRNILLLYPSERQSLKNALEKTRKEISSSTSVEKRLELIKQGIKPEDTKSIENDATEDDDWILDIDSILSSIPVSIKTKIYGANRTESVEAKKVTFTDQSIAFYKTTSKIKVLKAEEKQIEDKTVNELEVGNNVVFLKEGNRNIFDELIKYYEHNPKVTEQVQLSELWRKALIRFRNKHSYSITHIMRKLSEAGLNRGYETIDNWINGTVIYPQGLDSALDAIAKVTQDEELSQKLSEVKTACKQIAALRVKIGRYLAEKITQTAISEEAEIDDPVLRDKLNELIEQKQVVEVLEIDDEFTPVETSLINRLITSDELEESFVWL